MSPRVVLVGMPGNGKTTIGQRVAHALGTTFTDSDQLIAERFNMPCGKVLEELGEEEFRKIEHEVIAGALQGSGVLALGGGAVVTPATRELLAHQVVVRLDLPVDEAMRRLSGNRSRPLLNVEDPRAAYEKLLTQRGPLYEEVSDYTIAMSNKSSQRVVTEILTFMEDIYPDQLPSERP